MTQPSDKWKQIAFGLFIGKSGMVDEPGMIDAAANALRSAYEEGDRAGLERANERMASGFDRLDILRKMWSAKEVANWIRGEDPNKETKE